jgi:hypothetical protein
LIAGASEDANATGDLDITNTTCKIVIQGEGPGRTIIDGGLIDRVFHFSSGVTACVNDVTIRNGKPADGSDGVTAGAPDGGNGQSGGAIRNAGTLEIRRCAIRLNTAGDGGDGFGPQPSLGGNGGNGGGVSSIGSLAMTASTIGGNTAGAGGTGTTQGGNGGFGGGIHSSGALTLNNSTITGNEAGEGDNVGGVDGNGGGVRSAGAATVRHSTIKDNTAGTAAGSGLTGVGGGLSATVALAFDFNILDGNQAAAGSHDGSATLQSPAYNVISDTTGFTITGTPTGNLANVSAQLNSLADNFGPTGTCLPMPASPAINAVDAGYPNVALIDQRGAGRPTNGVTVDAGAVEVTTDFDGDGIPDSNEALRGLDPEEAADACIDPDKDGFLTIDEYIAATSHTNAASFFEIIAIVNQSPVSVFFNSSASRVYTLQFKTSLANPTWINVSGQVDQPGNGGVDFLTDPNPSARRFYRVEVSLPSF